MRWPTVSLNWTSRCDVRYKSGLFGPSITKPQAIRSRFPPLRAFHSNSIRLHQNIAVQESSGEKLGQSHKHPSTKAQNSISGVETYPNGEAVKITFRDGAFTFHAQWLHDAQVDKGPSKDDSEVFSQKIPKAFIQNTNLAGTGVHSILEITWNDGTTTSFPVIWLRVLAPLVGKADRPQVTASPRLPGKWQANTFSIPEFPYTDMFPENPTPEAFNASLERILDTLLQDSGVGIVKIVNLPPTDLKSERDKENTLVTKILKQLFGGVFFHPRRGVDKTFNVASHHQEDKKRGIELPNYNTNKVLLPHTDHAHYIHPARVQGLYALEGESENTFVSCFAALETLQIEAPHLYQQLFTAPMATGRVAYFYDPPMYQATTDTVITMHPGFPGHVKRFRWHPHLTGSLLSPFDDFPEARVAYQTFQEIMRRDSHLLRFLFKPGDLYIWDNFRVLHGRERVVNLPRTAVGQTVPEQLVADRYRVLKMAKLKNYIDDKWLVHTPMQQLHELVELVDATRLGY
jgi:trimethyllysine dioxygenase